MRGEIKSLAKAAVTGLVKPDDLVVQAGHAAIDKLFAWLPGKDKSQLKQLVEDVAGELQQLADREFDGSTDLEAAIGNATTLFEQHGLSASDLIALNLDPARATKELLDRGAAIFGGLEPSVADLCQKHIVPQVMQRLLADRQFLEDLQPTITSTVLARLDDIRQLLRENPPPRADIDGQGNIVVQIIGDDNRVDLGRPYLTLTRYLTRRTDPEDRSDADLLSPYSRSIPLVGRDEEQADLHGWLTSGKPISIRVLTGGAGSGKTRLAIELCEAMFELGWAAGFVESRELVRFQDKQNLSDWAWGRPTLLVVDYAAVHAARLNEWLGELANNPGDAQKPLRLLLLERQAEPGSGWWQTMVGGGWGTSTIERLFDPNKPQRVKALRSQDVQRDILASTLEAVGSAIRPPEPGMAPDFDRQLAELTWGGEPLFLMMAALLAAEVDFDRVLALSRTDLAFDIVRRHELPRIERFGGGNDSKTVMLVHMVVYVTLCRGLGYEPLLTAIEQEMGALRRGSAGDAAALANDLCLALPGASGDAAPILPDMIGEAATLLVLASSKVDGRAVVLRAFEQASQQVAAAVIRTAQDFAGQEVDGKEILAPLEWLDALIEHNLVDVDQLMMIANQLPQTSHALGGHAVRILEEISQILGERVANGDLGALPNFATSLNNLAKSLSELGRFEDALGPAEEAVAIRRKLSANEPDAFRPVLATSLNNLAAYLNKVGRWNDALDPAEEAVEIYGKLAAKEPDIFRPDLAGSLNNLAIYLKDLGRWADALGLAEEAVTIYRTMVAKARETFRPDLATSLNTIALCLGELGRWEDALDPAEKAVVIYRELAAKAPDTFRPALAMLLSNPANYLCELGRWEDALDPAEKAVAIHGELAAKAPDAVRPALAMSLNTLANCLSGLGRREDALGPAETAVTIQGELASAQPEAFGPDLAGWLATLANILEVNDRLSEALERNREAIVTYRPFFLAQPPAFAHWMIPMCRLYLQRCEKLRRDPDGALLGPIVEVIQRLQAQGERSGGTSG